jgi:hypothetical protein
VSDINLSKNKKKRNKERTYPLFYAFFSLLKSIEFHSSNRLNDDQTENSSKKSIESLLEKNRPIKNEQTQIKVSQIDSESKFI